MLAVTMALGACDTPNPSLDDEAALDGEAEASRRHVTHEEALDRAAALHAGTTYSDLGEPYGCTQDCSGHEAGVAWASENDLRDPSECGGRSRSFIEGCEAYTEALQEAAHEIEMDGQ